jgi:hypothetical protein
MAVRLAPQRAMRELVNDLQDLEERLRLGGGTKKIESSIMTAS